MHETIQARSEGSRPLVEPAHPHKFQVHGHELTTWCALDPLVIAPTMTDSVEVESDDPSTGKPIHISVDPGGAVSYQPETAVLSIVIPESGAHESIEGVCKMFCHQVYSFTSRDTADKSFSTDDRELCYLPVEDAFQLGRLLFGPIHALLRGVTRRRSADEPT